VRRALLTAVVLTAAAAVPARAIEIPGSSPPATTFEGAPATARGIASPLPPRHPQMAPNGRGTLHVDAYQTDAHEAPGPLGRDTTVTSTFQFADCASVTFDSRGRIVTVCVGLQGPRVVVMDPVTLRQDSSYVLPPRQISGLGIFNDFSGGGYFYLDDRDRAVVPTSDRSVFVIGTRNGLRRERAYDVRSAVPNGDKLISALPDWSGRIWFASTRGVVGAIDPASGAVRSYATREPIDNSIAVDETGAVYVVTGRALYRFDAGARGEPVVSWREVYRNSGIAKPGQVGAGSGTTPTVMSGRRVAITDNADPMNVVVYRGERRLRGRRLICEQPVFRRGASATDNSLIAAGNSLVVENNYGYSGPAAVSGGRTTSPGIERVDVGRRGCRTIWRSPETAPTVVPKLSLSTGLVYAYTKPARSDRNDPWYLTAIDFCTGRTAFRRYTGDGLGYNNNYAPVTLGPDGAAYVGTLGGLVRIADGRRPPFVPAAERRGCNPAPRIALRLSGRRGRRCLRAPIRASLVGADRGQIRRAEFAAGARRLRDRRAPFARTVVRRSRRAGTLRVRARARLRSGRLIRVVARANVCS
jgi:hypothetical protein